MAKRLNLKTQTCPSCNQVGTIRKIIWGLPESGVDEDKYIIGGCLIPDDEPPHGCINCDWTGKITRSIFIDIECKPKALKCPSCDSVGTIQRLMNGNEVVPFEDKPYKFTRFYDDDPKGNAECSKCGWHCIARDMSSWRDYAP